jgi:hypothetical protein
MAKSRRKTGGAATSQPSAEHHDVARTMTAPADGAAPHPTAPQNAGATTAVAIDRERIAHRAYELYLQRGGTDGSAMSDWLTAERELRESRARAEDEL